MIYKLVARDPISRVQYKKWIYDCEDKFNKYSKDIIDRYTTLNYNREVWYDVEVYRMYNDKYQYVGVYKGVNRKDLC